MTNKSIEYHSLKNLYFTLVREQDKENNSNYSCFFLSYFVSESFLSFCAIHSTNNMVVF